MNNHEQRLESLKPYISKFKEMYDLNHSLEDLVDLSKKNNLSIVDAITAISNVTGLRNNEIKTAIWNSPAWKENVEINNKFHDKLLDSLPSPVEENPNSDE